MSIFLLSFSSSLKLLVDAMPGKDWSGAKAKTNPTNLPMDSINHVQDEAEEERRGQDPLYFRSLSDVGFERE